MYKVKDAFNKDSIDTYMYTYIHKTLNTLHTALKSLNM